MGVRWNEMHGVHESVWSRGQINAQIMSMQIPSNVLNQHIFGQKVLPVLQISIPRAALQGVWTLSIYVTKP